MEQLTQVLQDFSDSYIWGLPLIFLLVGTGLYLTVGLALLPLRKLTYGFQLLWQGRKETDEQGDISPFKALMTAMSATVGTGNIVGVAGAIAIGGPGAVFWMWMTALVGMATKYSEAVLAVKYREVDERGHYQGGPMYYIKNGLDAKWRWLAFAFALFGALAAFGIGNGVQINSLANNLNVIMHVPLWVTGLVISILTAAVLIGGIKRIGTTAAAIVPFMAIIYVIGAFIIIISHASELPAAFKLIFTHAFTGTALTGGFVGASIMVAIQAGVARGLFSNEAGLGSAPIAHAAAKTNDPIRQGTIGMLGTFIDTIIICTLTALVIVIMNGWTQTDPHTGKLMEKVVMTLFAFEQGLPSVGQYIVAFGLTFFTFTTIIGWSYYGERCAEYLLGVKVIPYYRTLWIIVVFAGAMLKPDLLWVLAGILNGLMAFPNLIALLLLSPIVFKLSKDYFAAR